MDNPERSSPGLPPHTAPVLLTAFVLLAAAVAADLARPWTLAWLLLGAPLVEEVSFRLGLQESLLRRLPADQAWAANLITALAFAGAHLLVRPGWLAAATVLPALLIGHSYGRTRRLLPCVLWHALFNLAGAGMFGLQPTP
jgi:membrane protease YdiL (CAAX protease family)